MYLFSSAFSEICSLPNILTGYLPKLLNGSTLLLVLIPACCLAGAVTVVGKLTLGTAVKVGLVTETAVAHLSGETEKKTERLQLNEKSILLTQKKSGEKCCTGL